MLHDDKENFEQIVLKVSKETGIEASVIEKDYYVTLFLKRIVEAIPNIIFKGGTSLSKCYKLINRFSEDIDLNIETDKSPTEGQRKNLKKVIVSIIDEFHFNLENVENIRSRRSFNRYIIEYPTLFPTYYLKQHLMIETAVHIKSYPCKKMQATSLVYDYLENNGFYSLIKMYELEPFNVNVQTAQRTFIDKLYALGDYYLNGNITEHSRHIYDIYKLLEIVQLDDSLKKLAREVYIEREPHTQCFSAKPGINMNKLLQEIIDREVYREDYEIITMKLLFEEITYETAISKLKEVLEYNLF